MLGKVCYQLPFTVAQETGRWDHDTLVDKEDARYLREKLSKDKWKKKKPVGNSMLQIKEVAK
jgi:hypothetical protein